MSQPTDTFGSTAVSSELHQLAEAIAESSAVLFVGAGFSLNNVRIRENSNRYFKDWHQFMVQLAAKLWEHETPERRLELLGTDYIYVTQLFKERFSDEIFYREFLEAVPTEEFGPSPLHLELLSLYWSDIITTNQDDLLEKALRILNLDYQIVVEDNHLTATTLNRLIKMHGTWERPTSIIFSEEDYRTFERKHPLISIKVKQLFAEKTAFFLGFGLRDTNFKNIYMGIHDALDNFQKPAYAYVHDVYEHDRIYWRKRRLYLFSKSDVPGLAPGAGAAEGVRMFVEMLIRQTLLVQALRGRTDYSSARHLAFEENFGAALRVLAEQALNIAAEEDQ